MRKVAPEAVLVFGIVNHSQVPPLFPAAGVDNVQLERNRGQQDFSGFVESRDGVFCLRESYR